MRYLLLLYILITNPKRILVYIVILGGLIININCYEEPPENNQVIIGALLYLNDINITPLYRMSRAILFPRPGPDIFPTL